MLCPRHSPRGRLGAGGPSPPKPDRLLPAALVSPPVSLLLLLLLYDDGDGDGNDDSTEVVCILLTMSIVNRNKPGVCVVLYLLGVDTAHDSLCAGAAFSVATLLASVPCVR